MRGSFSGTNGVAKEEVMATLSNVLLSSIL
jgi:hypothetical protein